MTDRVIHTVEHGISYGGLVLRIAAETRCSAMKARGITEIYATDLGDRASRRHVAAVSSM